MFLFTYIAIQYIITMEFIIMIASFVNGLPTTTLRWLGWRFITNRATAFIIDLTISCIIGWFTGEGMTSGFANLLSGIIASWTAPYILEFKFKYSKLEAEYTKNKELKKQKGNPFEQARNKIKGLKDTLFSQPKFNQSTQI